MGIVMMILGIAIAIGIMLFVNKSERIKKDVATLFIVAFLVSVVLEIFTFNYTTYENIGQSLNKSESTLTYNGNTVSSTNEDYTAKRNVDSQLLTLEVEIKNINSKVNDIFVAPSENMGKTKVHIDYKDEVLTDGSSVEDEDIYVVPEKENTQYIRLHLSGKTSELKLRLETEKQGVSATTIKVGVNQGIPFRFSAARLIIVTLVFFILAIIYEYRNLNYAGEKSKKVRRVAIVSLLIVSTLFMFFLARAQQDPKNSFFFDKKESVQNYDQYQKLAVAFTKGDGQEKEVNGIFKC